MNCDPDAQYEDLGCRMEEIHKNLNEKGYEVTDLIDNCGALEFFVKGILISSRINNKIQKCILRIYAYSGRDANYYILTRSLCDYPLIRDGRPICMTPCDDAIYFGIIKVIDPK